MARKHARRRWQWAVAVAALLLVGFLVVVPWVADRHLNTLSEAALPPVSAEARALHASVPVTDLHNDLLLWSRDPRRRHSRGHSDLPRLRQGGVRVQIFSAVIRTPYGQNYERNPADSDRLLPLLVAQMWPPRTWTSDYRRAVFQAVRLNRAAGSNLQVVRTASDLSSVLQDSTQDPPLAAVLAIEGMHALEGDFENLPRLFNLGYRIFGLVHFFDNRLGGSAHGQERGGLTPFGRRVVAWIERNQGLVDLAHAAPALIDDVLRVATRPVIVSHTGVQATCPGPRTVSDDHLHAIASGGGLIGVGFWRGATCGGEVSDIVRAIRHVVEVAGVDAVALGSDFDGATRVPFDASELAHLTQALLDEGLPYDAVQAIIGQNAVRVLQENLPQ